MAEVITKKTQAEYDTQTFDLTISQFRRELYLAKLSAFNKQLDEIEDVLQQLLIERWLDTAVGAQLDIVGSITNVDRQGRIDIEYRAAIAQRIALRFSGTPEAIIEIIQTLYGGTFVTLTEAFPAKIHIETDAIITSSDLVDITAAGVGGYIITDCIIDALGNFIVDALGNSICTVVETIITYIVTAQNDEFVDALGNNIIIFEQM